MSGETFDCLAKRPKQYETFRGDLAGTQFAEVEVDVETGVVRVVKMVSVDGLRAEGEAAAHRAEPGDQRHDPGRILGGLF